ncbi:MAG TPA: hypothetical protein VJI46_06240 [Candidatus Nanoarchaeia archaeon]|nr:hypothetical protein [Candidatus Nanoarchaeia archaeon]
MVDLNLEFGKKKEMMPMQPDVSNQVRDLSGRIRTMEDVLANIRKKIQLTDSNLISRSKQIEEEIKATYADIKEIKAELNDLRDKAAMMFRELRLRATSDDVKVLQRYLEMWDPVKFVTKNDVDAIVDEKLRALGKGK